MPPTRWSMLREFIRDPFSTGSICSSSASLCRTITNNKRLTQADVVVELGAGTGCISHYLMQTIKHDATFLSVEKNPHLYKSLLNTYSSSNFVLGGAENLPQILQERSIDKADVIISSLPWASFPSSLQDTLTRAIRTSLKPNGIFLTYAYVCGAVLPSFLAFRKTLENSFSTVDTSKIVWNNFPPAFIYQCQEPVPVQ